MDDELPPIFDKLTPRPAPGELRKRVMAAVDDQLPLSSIASDTNPTRQRGGRPTSSPLLPSLARRVSGWERTAELFVAASLVIGVGWNAWQWRDSRSWQTAVFGAPAVPSSVASLGEAVASVTDVEVARAIIQRIGRSKAPSTNAPAFIREYQKLIDEITGDKEPVL